MYGKLEMGGSTNGYFYAWIIEIIWQNVNKVFKKFIKDSSA